MFKVEKLLEKAKEVVEGKRSDWAANVRLYFGWNEEGCQRV